MKSSGPVIVEMNTESLLEKRKSQLNVMLNWTKQQSPRTTYPQISIDDCFEIKSVGENGGGGGGGANSLSPSSLDHVDLTSSLFDSLNENITTCKLQRGSTKSKVETEKDSSDSSPSYHLSSFFFY